MTCWTNNPWGKISDSAVVWQKSSRSRFFEFDDRLTYSDLHNKYYHMIPYLCKGHFVFRSCHFLVKSRTEKWLYQKTTKDFWLNHENKKKEKDVRTSNIICILRLTPTLQELLPQANSTHTRLMDQGLLYLANSKILFIIVPPQLFFLCGMTCWTNNPWGKISDSAPIWLNHL